jgi:hypothetical protein
VLFSHRHDFFNVVCYPSDGFFMEDDGANIDQEVERLEMAIRPYRPLLEFSCGALSCFYGRHFTYTLLYAQVFRHSGLPILKRALLEIRSARLLPRLRSAGAVVNDTVRRISHISEALRRARESGNDHEAVVLEAELAELQREVLEMGQPASSFLSAIDPGRLVALGRELYGGLSSLASQATTNCARRVGIYINIGEQLSRVVHDAVAPLLRRLLQGLRRYSPAIDALHNDVRGSDWLELALRAICSSIGIGVAFYFESLVFSAANAQWGAELMLSTAASGARALMSHQHPLHALLRTNSPAMRSASWLLAAAGLHHQDLGSGRRLPAAYRLVLLAPLISERWLRAVTCTVRSIGASEPAPARDPPTH